MNKMAPEVPLFSNYDVAIMIPLIKQKKTKKNNAIFFGEELAIYKGFCCLFQKKTHLCSFGEPVPYWICIYCNYSGLGNKQLYWLQIVYGFVWTFPQIKWFHSPLGKNVSVMLQLCFFSVFENVTLLWAGRWPWRGAMPSLYTWLQESEIHSPTLFSLWWGGTVILWEWEKR